MDSITSLSDLEGYSDTDDESLSPAVVSKIYLDSENEQEVPDQAQEEPEPEDEVDNNEDSSRESVHQHQQHTQPQLNSPRSVYLITYSQADVLKVTSREKFGEIIANEFNRNEDDTVIQWVSSAELHRIQGVHYHCAIKLKCPRRWKQVRQNLVNNYKINVDFQGFHDTYYDAFTYVVKQDKHYVTSPGHINLDNNPPQTAAAIRAKRVNEIAAPKVSSKPKRPRLDNASVFHIVTDNNLHTDKQLCAFASIQMKEGKDDLHRWVMNHPNVKSRQDILETAWRMVNADKDIERENKCRMDILREVQKSIHRTDPDTGVTCEGTWLTAALEILDLNNISVPHFCNAIRTALKKGRGKGRNLMIIGETNCAKSFMFLPLLHMYDCFTCPSDSTFNFVGAHEKEVLLFNDIRYGGNGDGDRKFMPWRMFLNLLEGAPINVPMPKNHFSADVQWVKRQPIFATSDRKIVRVMNHKLDLGETNQMDERWEYIHFKHQFQKAEINYDLVHCPRCFADLVLNN